MPYPCFFAAANAPALTIGPFTLLLCALPVLLLGEWLNRRIPALARSNIPPGIVGGLLVALALYALSLAAPGSVALQGSTSHAAWLWSVLPQWEPATPKPMDVERPLLILFFTCIGLNASWQVARQGGVPLVKYLALAIGIGVIQAVTGAATALGLGQPALLGVMTSNVSLMGGFGTAAGFAPEFEKAGLQGAASIGIAAAAFGVVAGGLIAGLVGGRLVESKVRLRAAASKAPAADDRPEDNVRPPEPATFLAEVRDLARAGGATMVHLGVLVVAMKLGAFVSSFIQQSGITFPVYMGSMIVAAALRNLHDACGGRLLTTSHTDAVGSVALAWLLTVVMIDLQLAELAHAALPMLVILTLQVALLAALSSWLVFRVMGRDYEAAVMSAGMIGFGLGATSNALASMRMLARRFGPAPRAFLIVPIVGAFLVDFANAVLTTGALNLLR